MKKHLLFTASIFTAGLLCAQVDSKASKISKSQSNIALQKSAVVQDKQMYFPFVDPNNQSSVYNNSTKRVNAYSETVIGRTNYDLQSNGSVGDRIVVNADNTIAAVWTFDLGDGGTYANRGTGYNYYNGSNWVNPVLTATRIENSRVGWGNIVNTASGKEVVLSHNGTAGIEKLHLATRPVKGTGAWSNSNTTITNVPGGNWWPRMVSQGENLYSISISYPVVNGGALYLGLDGALLFSRSTDGGATWDIQNQIPTGLDLTNYYKGFTGDNYAIAAKGSTVAIIAGDSGTDLILSKSTDNGATWTASTVMKFPLTKWDPTTQTSDIDSDGVPDTLETNDGNLAIALDNNGKAFVAYGRMRIINDGTNANGYSYFPYVDGLYIWNESMPIQMAGVTAGTNVAAVMEDRNGNGTIDFPTVPSGSYPFGLTRANSLTSFPSLAFDANNYVYLAYSAVMEGLVSGGDANKLVRHELIIKSLDEGVTWTTPYDVVPLVSGSEQEGIYGSIAKNVNGFVHMVYQRDFYPGNAIPATTGTNPDGSNGELDAGNEIVYVKVPVGDLVTVVTGIKNIESSVANLNLYPNPASTNSTIEVVLLENAKMDITVLNAVGQSVYSTSVIGNTGSNKVDINLTNLSSGLYFYQVKIGNSKSITKKFAIEK